MSRLWRWLTRSPNRCGTCHGWGHTRSFFFDETDGEIGPNSCIACRGTGDMLPRARVA